jgi:hypothetical protein
MERSDALYALRAFRDSLYECFERRADALFELTDSILTAGVFPSPVHLSLQPSHRRGWGSLYAALSQGRIDAEALRTLLGGYPLSAGEGPPVYAVDVSVWSRCDAEKSSPQRGYYYHPSRHSAGQPIVAGWAYQFIARLDFARDSWVAPMEARRVRPSENTNEVAAEQVKGSLDRLPEGDGPPLFVFDAGYDPVRLQRGLEGRRAQLLVRLIRAGRRFYADPEGPPARTGRPRRHGPKFDCKDPNSWPEPTHEHTSKNEHYGTVRVRAWAGLHPKVCLHEGRGSRGPLPIVLGGRWCWWKWGVYHVASGGASRRSCGCGGTALAKLARTSSFSGERTSGASTWSMPSASSSRLWGGPPLGCDIPSRPTAGRGWCSPLTRSSGWPARAWPSGGCRGRGATTIPVA